MTETDSKLEEETYMCGGETINAEKPLFLPTVYNYPMLLSEFIILGAEIHGYNPDNLTNQEKITVARTIESLINSVCSYAYDKRETQTRGGRPKKINSGNRRRYRGGRTIDRNLLEKMGKLAREGLTQMEMAKRMGYASSVGVYAYFRNHPDIKKIWEANRK